MASRKKKTEPPLAQRVKHLISLDATNVMRRLNARHDEVASLFSRLRDRGPMLEVVKSWFATVTFGELAALTPQAQNAVNTFYEALGELRWYLQYTEDMPSTVRTTIVQHLRTLETNHRLLIDEIGPPDAAGGDVVDAEVVRKLRRA